MKHITLRAHAKINLSLEVLDKRPDGYHNLSSVMQTLELHDTVYIKAVKKENYLKLVTNLQYLPSDGKNLAYKAAKMMIDRFEINDGIFINLEKRIPVSAGLGGGSADCAAVLVGMKSLLDLPAGRRDLLEAGLSMGADVPFCMTRGTRLAEGVGEKLTRLTPMPRSWILLIKPPVSVSTAEVFQAYKPGADGGKPDNERLLWYLSRRNLRGICQSMGNDLESVTASIHPIINDIKAFMLENGALGSIMSGSGPTVFGIFSDRKQAEAAETATKKRFSHITDIFLTEPFNIFSRYTRGR